jgi:Glycosyl transferase family 11
LIVVKLMGGLGNQMFQYAAARRLAHAHNASLGLDVSFLGGNVTDTPRNLELKHLSITAEIASPGEIASIRFKETKGVASLFSWSLRMLGKDRPAPRDFRERHFHFDPTLLNASDGVYLDGYWQSEKYFADIADIIRTEFTVRYPLDSRNKELAELIARTDSVSLHVRRGDYVANPQTAQYHNVCGLDYYARCLAIIGGQVKTPHLFVFSDDPRWVMENLKFSFPVEFVTHNGPEKGYEDMRLMSLCRHNIIANSSFSWWGAWLNGYPDKRVLAPVRWFNRQGIDTKDLLPDSWLRIEA